MDWSNRTIRPDRATPPKVDIRHPCPGISRFVGTIGFLAAGLGVYYGGAEAFGIEPIDVSAPNWTAVHVFLVIAAMLAGAVTGLLGFAAAMLIPVRSELLNDLFIVLWQFLANGIMVWILAVGVAMSVVLGSDEARAAVLRFGVERATWHVVGSGALVSLAMGACFALCMMRRLPFLVYLLPAVVVAASACHWHFDAYGIAGRAWMGVGIVVPLLVLVLAPPMIERDRRQRRMVGEMTS
jgi:hypothetical protein